MTVKYVLTPQLRLKLKQPLGKLIQGSFEQTMKTLKDLIEEEKTPTIISVGDIVSKNLIENNIPPKLLIIDNKVMRKKIEPFSLKAEKTVYAENPPGTITIEAFETIYEALRTSQQTKIVVDGEEDLLALIAILHAPEKAIVVYGQPREGIVVVKVTQMKKKEVTEILKTMEVVEKLNNKGTYQIHYNREHHENKNSVRKEKPAAKKKRSTLSNRPQPNRQHAVKS